jgi:hypothetical protein
MTNFFPEMTTGTAVFLSLLATFMWGSWFVSLKFLKDYPLDGFYLVLFITSFVLVWSVGFILDGPNLLGNVRQVFEQDPSRVLISLGCGVGYVFGMRISLYVMQTIGLSLSQPISASIGVVTGNIVSILIGGTPEGYSINRLIIACIFFIGAVFSAMMAARFRTNPVGQSDDGSSLNFTMRDMWKAFGWILLASAFTPVYIIGLSYGLKSVTQPHGLAVLPYMAMLVTGAFFASILLSIGILTYKKQWKQVLSAPFSIHKWGIISGLAHYGGNIIHTFATAYLSTAISWPLALTMGMWTQVWGIVFGEFKGSPKKVYVFLFTAIGFYILGGYIVASQSF